MRPDRVMVAPPPPLAREIAGRLELVDDAVHRALGDPDRVADLAQADARVARNAREHLRVIRQERPRWALAYRHDSRIVILEACSRYSQLTPRRESVSDVRLQMRRLQDPNAPYRRHPSQGWRFLPEVWIAARARRRARRSRRLPTAEYR